MLFKTPKLLIILFVALSMLVAVTYHHWPLIRSGNFFSLKKKEINNEFIKLKRDIANQKEDDFDEVKNCQCTNESSNYALLQIEDKESCKNENLKFQNIFEAMPVLFKYKRNQPISDLPRLCVVYALKQIDRLKISDKKTSDPCNEKSQICVTNEYVNVMYNSFGEVMNCLKVPQKDVFPFLFFKSRFHINSSSGVAGITKIQIETIKQVFDLKKAELLKSEDIHCQRIATFVKDFNLDDSNKCLLNQAPENPLLSFYLFGLLFRQNQDLVIQLVDQIETKEILKKFGHYDSDHDQLKITLTLASIYYGYEKVSEMFKSYLLNANDGQNFQNFIISENPKDELFLQLIAVSIELNRVFKEGTCVSESFLTQ